MPPGGVTWAPAIVDAITQSKAVLLLVSQQTNVSRHLPRELDIADKNQIPLLPLRMSDVAMGGALNYYLDNTQWLNLYPGEIKDHAAELVRTVSRLIQQQQPATAAASGEAATTAAAARPAVIEPRREPTERAAVVPSPVSRRPAMLWLAEAGIVVALAASLLYVSRHRSEQSVPPALVNPTNPEEIVAGVRQITSTGDPGAVSATSPWVSIASGDDHSISPKSLVMAVGFGSGRVAAVGDEGFVSELKLLDNGRFVTNLLKWLLAGKVNDVGLARRMARYIRAIII